MFGKITLLATLICLFAVSSAFNLNEHRQRYKNDIEAKNEEDNDSENKANLNYEWIEIERLLKRIGSCKNDNPLYCYMNGCLFDCASEPNIRSGNDFIACSQNCLYITKTLFELEVLT